MARTPRNELAATELGKRLRDLKQRQAPDATPKEIELWIYRHTEIKVGDETVRRALHGEVDPTQCNAEVIAGLSAYFEVSPAELGTFARERMDRLLAAVGASIDPHDGGDTVHVTSRNDVLNGMRNPPASVHFLFGAVEADAA